MEAYAMLCHWHWARLANLDVRGCNSQDEFLQSLENKDLSLFHRRIAPARSRVPDKALVERTAAEAERAAARNAEKIPGVEAAARQKIEKAEARRRKAAEDFEGWKTEFFAEAENRESPFAVRALTLSD
jgi:hypothetical protein